MINKDKLVELTSKALAIGVSAFELGDNLKEELVFNIALSKVKELQIDYESGEDKEIAYVRLTRKGITMYFNPAKALEVNAYLFENETNPVEREKKMLAILRAIIKHELLHVMLKHLVRQPNRSNQYIMNIVTDSLINSLITEFKYFKNHIYAVTPETIAHIENKANMELTSKYRKPLFGKLFDETVMYNPIIIKSVYAELNDFNFERYYDFIANNLKQLALQVVAKHVQGQDNKQNQDNQQGQGNYQDKDSKQSNDKQQAQSKAQQMTENADKSDSSNGSNDNFDKPKIETQAFGDIEPVDANEIDPQTTAELDSLIEEIIERSRGTQIGHLIEEVYINSKKKETVNWRQILKQQMQSGSNIVKKYSIKRYDRRYDIPPGKKMFYQSGIIRVLIDTSGSISSNDFQDFLSEIYILAKKYGYRIDGYFYDVQPQGQFTERDIKRKVIQVKGRGGTNLRNTLKILNEQQDLQRATVTVILTDGEDDPPSKDEINSDKTVFLFTKYHNKSFEQAVSKWAIVGIFENGKDGE